MIGQCHVTVNKSVNNPHVSLVQILPPRPLPIEHVRQVRGADPQFLSNSCMELADKLAAAQTETAAMILTRSWNENASRNHGINHDVWCGDSLCSLAGIRFALEG